MNIIEKIKFQGLFRFLYFQLESNVFMQNLTTNYLKNLKTITGRRSLRTLPKFVSL
jgi:hypothetical protein